MNFKILQIIWHLLLFQVCDAAAAGEPAVLLHAAAPRTPGGHPPPHTWTVCTQ